MRDIPLLIRLVIGSLDLTPRHEAPPPTTVAKAHLETSDVPILTLPEQMMTNGRGILKFASWPFSISANVQVVCIDVQRLHVFAPNLTYLFSSPIGDFFWTLFCPAHWANVRLVLNNSITFELGKHWSLKSPSSKLTNIIEMKHKSSRAFHQFPYKYSHVLCSHVQYGRSTEEFRHGHFFAIGLPCQLVSR